MFIKELEISGFKSFGTKVKINFDKSISAIVGPNGCGKSNILDAMKWVLGEKSVKSMRGDKLEDVIFSGTETVKASGMATVSFLLDNKNRKLSVDTDEVKISRSLYRDGQSQYYLNGAKVLRKEIEKTLMDTGLGKSSYSFMEQGKMDMILSSKPEERRMIFEEAAGISRYKAQKEEALKNLENTQINITRLKDVQNELNRELKLKEDQANKTKLYNQLIEKKKENELKVHYLALVELEKNLEKNNENLQRKLEEKEKIHQKVLLFEENIKQLDEEKEKNQKELHKKDMTNQINREKISQWEKTVETNAKRKTYLTSELESQTSQMQKHKNRLDELKKETAAQNQLTLQLDNKLENAEGVLKEISSKIITLEKEIQNNEKNFKTLTEEFKENQKSLITLRLELEKVVKDLLKSLKEEKDKWVIHEKEQSNKKNHVLSKVLAIIEELAAIHELLNKKSIIPAQEHVNNLLTSIKEQKWHNLIEEIGDIGEGLRHLLFEKGGIHSKKEEIDDNIEKIEKRNKQIEIEKESLQKQTEEYKTDYSSQVRQKEQILGDIRNIQTQKTNLIERENRLKEQIKHEETSINFLTKQYKRIESEILQLDNYHKDISKEIQNIKKGIENEISLIESIEKKISSIQNKKNEYLEKIHQENQKNSDLFQKVGDLEVKIGTYLGSKEALIQEIYNDFNLTYEQVKERFEKKKIIPEKEKEILKELKRELDYLGPINPLAIDELKNIKNLYDHNKKQLDDVISAKDNIAKIIKDIDEKSAQLFIDSFKKIQHNFTDVFQKLFQGGKAKLSLTDPENPLTSGIDIQVQPPGKRPRSLKLLSGGEKALTAIALMFGIYMVRSSPFCVLDEIDAPLDDQNVNRFLTLLDDFKKNTQFILITHNKKTMSKADFLYGITMEEPGISKVLSVELKTA
ncbi:MAG: AAA family ATPase [Spirochaetia bacterium]|nr:AAA family ATPase [Spirochaetia bacterium]